MELTIAAAWEESHRKPPLRLLLEGVRRSSAASALNDPDISKLGVRCLEELTGNTFISPFNFHLSSCLAIQVPGHILVNHRKCVLKPLT
jgi:hypothetical protein